MQFTVAREGRISLLERLLITGSSGYLGTVLVNFFRQAGVLVCGIDIQEPVQAIPDQFVPMDICQAELAKVISDFAPDSVIHAAYVFDPDADPVVSHRTNIDGTRNVIRAVGLARPRRFMFVSSATAYGAWPDNPVPMVEQQPLRAREGFRYAADKVLIENMLTEFSVQFPQITTSCVRPTVIGGPGMDNYLKQILVDMPFLTRLDGYDVPFQFVHEADMSGAISAILSANASGAFNIAPADVVLLSHIGRITGRWVISMPLWLCRLIHGPARILRLPAAATPKDFLYFVRYPWIVSSDRLLRETGFQFQYTSEQTMMQILGDDSIA